MDGYKKLVVWRKADELARQVYLATKDFPSSEQYGLTSQIRRAAVSIPVNLAEGAGRQNRNETKHFANIALGSLAETEYPIHFCTQLKLFGEEEQGALSVLVKDVGALLWKFHKSF